MSVIPVTVTIAGVAVAKGRLTRRGVTYTPAATRQYEALTSIGLFEQHLEKSVPPVRR